MTRGHRSDGSAPTNGESGRSSDEALRENERRYRTLYETMAQGVVYQSSDGSIVSANPAAERILGLSHDQMQGRTSTDPRWPAIHEDGSDFPGENHPSMVALRTGREVHAVVMGVFNPQADSYRWIEINSVPQYLPGETTPYQAFTTFDDITERKRAEEAVVRERDTAQDYLDIAGNMIVALDSDGIVTLANPACCATLGAAAEQVVGSDWFARFVPERMRANVRAVFRQMLRGEVEPVEYYENPVLTAAGEERTVAWHNAIVKGDQGEIVGTLSSGDDITERKKAERALRESQVFLDSIVEQSPHAMWISDERGTLIRLNQACRDLLNITDAEVVGKYSVLADNIVEEQGHMPAVRRVFEAGEVARFTLHHPSGRLKGVDLEHTVDRHLEVTVSPVLDENGRVVHAIIQHIDITDRMRAEIALRESEARLRRFYESGLFGVIYWTMDGRITDANDKFLEMLGYSREELEAGEIGWQALTPPEFAELDERSIAELKATGVNARPFEKEYLRKDGSRLPIMLGSATLDEERETGVAFVLDITERTRAEDALRQSEARIRSLFEDSPISLWEEDFSGVKQHITRLQDSGVGDLRTHFEEHPEDVAQCAALVRVVDVNRATLELYAAGSRDELRSNLTRVFGEESYGVFLEEIVALCEGQTTFESEAINQTLTGEKLTVFMKVSVVSGYENTLSRVLVSITDVSARVEAEAALRESELLHRSVLDNAGIGVGLWDMDGHLLFFNPIAAANLGGRPADFAGQTLLDLFGAEAAGVYLQRIREVADDGPVSEFEDCVPLPAGRRWFLSVYAVVKDDDGDIVGVQVFSHDITERKQAEEEIRRLNAELERRVSERTAELEEAVRELESFSYSVSHDLRAPLRALDGFSQILIEDYGEKLDAEGRGHLERIRRADQKMGMLIDGLLELSRLNRSELHRRSVDLSALAREITAELAEAEPERRVDLEIADGLTAEADRDLVRALLANLLANAWKFTSKHEQAKIELGTVDVDGERAFYVSDDGAGFEMAYVEKLFGAFQRLHGPEEFEGLGIGLATVARIVHRHGGRAWAEGKVEKGATFYFTLPEGSGG